jgi:hypothetical protein
MHTLKELLEKRPELKLVSKGKLYQTLNDDGITKDEINKHLNPNEITQIYAKPNKRAMFKITASPYSFQMDIGLLPAYKKQNKGKDKFLILVDILSHKAFTYVLKSGKMKDVLDVYETFLVDVEEQVNSVAGDDFFNDAEFQEFNKELYISVFPNVAKDDHITKMGDKLTIVDRCIRTIKQLLQKYMLTHNTTKWTGALSQIIDLYNDKPNEGIKDMKPNQVFDDCDCMQGLYKGQKKQN